MSETKFHSAYFTPPEQAELLLTVLADVWGPDFDLLRNDDPAAAPLPPRGGGAWPPLRILEPAVGAGAIVREATGQAIQTSWVTNELHPEGSNFNPNFTRDFFQLTPSETGPIDIVIGNPPFSGATSVMGVTRSDLATAFVAKAVEFAPRVAFIMPAAALAPRRLANLPRDVHVVAHTPPKAWDYSLGGAGAGDSRLVKTTVVLYEHRPGTDNGFALDGSDIPGFEWTDTYVGATHAIQMWGGFSVRSLDGAYGRAEPYAREDPCRITDPDIEAMLNSTVVAEYIERCSSTCVATSKGEVTHVANRMLKGMKGERTLST